MVPTTKINFPIPWFERPTATMIPWGNFGIFLEIFSNNLPFPLLNSLYHFSSTLIWLVYLFRGGFKMNLFLSVKKYLFL